MLQGKVVGGAILLLLIGGCAPSGKETRTAADAPSPQASQPASSVTAPGAKVFIDPATGLQRAPTEQEWAAMVQQEQLRKKTELTAPSAGGEIILSDGTRGYMLGKGSKTSVRACKEANGSTTVGHDCPSSTDETNGQVP
jgi:hypothetical protein